MTILRGERVTDYVIVMVAGWTLKTEIWPVAFIPLLPTGYESPVGLTNGEDLNWFHRPSFAATDSFAASWV